MELKDKIKKFVTDFRDGAYQHDTKRDSGNNYCSGNAILHA